MDFVIIMDKVFCIHDVFFCIYEKKNLTPNFVKKKMGHIAHVRNSSNHKKNICACYDYGIRSI